MKENIDLYQDDPEFESFQLLVDPRQSPIRLDQYISDHLAKISRNKIQNAISTGLITVNDILSKSNYKVRPRDVIEIQIPKSTAPEEVIPQNIPLNIVYEDDDILIINKEAGMVVHPAIGNYEGTLVNALAFYLQHAKPFTKSDRYGLVHRIDKETSGLLVIAKNDFSVAHISKQFFEHTIHREYLALVWGEPDPPAGTIIANIVRDPRNRQRMLAISENHEGKNAITHYEVLESFYYTSLLKCKLETGRTHQIRAHMQYIGHPLFNDTKYDGDRIHKGTIFSKYKQFIQNCYKLVPRFLLHAKNLGLIHPRTGKELFFESEPPQDFIQLIEKWRNYTNTLRNKSNLE